MWDVLIKNGKVVGGSGNPWFKADVAIKNGRIASIGDLNSNSADVVIDANNMIVCTGFIDMHSHSDFALLMNRYAESKVRRGVTTEVIGNCGNSAAPLNEELRKNIRRKNPIMEEAGITLNWSKMKEFFKILEDPGISINVASLVGHQNIRVITRDIRIGFQHKRS